MQSSLDPTRPDPVALSPDNHRARISDLVATVNRLRGRGGSARLAIIAWAVALAIGLGAASLMKAQYDTARAGVTHEIENLAAVLGSEAARTLQAVELAQRAVRERVGPVATPAAWREALAGQAVHEDLRRRIESLPQVDALTTIDSQGNLINFSRYWPIPQVNIADRDYFQALSADPARRHFVSAPVRNRGDGVWTFYLARSVSDERGGFLGLILAGLDLRYFETLYRDLALGPHFSVGLFRDDGTLLVRHPAVERGGPPVTALAEAVGQVRLIQHGRAAVYSSTGAFGGGPRIVAAVPLQHYPLAVVVAAGEQEVIARWRGPAIATGIAALSVELVILVASLLVRQQLRAQRRLAEANLARGHAEADLASAWARAEAERAARERDTRYVLALNSMSQGLCMFDTAHRLSLMNHRFEAMFDLAPGALAIGMPSGEVLALLLGPAQGGDADAVADLLARSQAALDHGEVVSFVHDHPDGRAWSVCMVPEDNGGWLMTFEDVTVRRRAEAKAAYLARHDALTGLANRNLFRERLEAAITRGREGQTSALLLLDLDRFKSVNDTMGHPVGDALLRAVAERLRNHCRPGDTIGRLGGDEFAIIQAGPIETWQAGLLAERLIEALGRPYRLEGKDVRIGTSIGIAVLPADGDDAAVVMKRADLALYDAKRDRGSYTLFSPVLEHAAMLRPALENALRGALVAGQFEVFYQPILDLHRGTLEGLEALVRWHHPERGLVNPGEFIPMAEEIGLIREIDAWVLRRACRDALAWPSGLQLSVNLSTLHFQESGPAAMVEQVLAETGFPASRLELEITETARLDPTRPVQAMMHALKALGVRLAVDDLGAGYARLEYLRSFPLDTVKIDKSLIDDVASGEHSRAIVEALGGLCARLGLTSTVEGVETMAQLRELQLGPCINAQGYLFGRPCPAEEVPAMCRRFGLKAVRGTGAVPAAA